MRVFAYIYYICAFYFFGLHHMVRANENCAVGFVGEGRGADQRFPRRTTRLSSGVAPCGNVQYNSLRAPKAESSAYVWLYLEPTPVSGYEDTP